MRRALLHVLLVIAGSAGASSAAADGVDALRERLRQVRNERQGELADGAFDTVAYTLDVVERIRGRFGPQAEAWQARAKRYLQQLEEGVDPFGGYDGQLLMRGYRSPLSQVLQGYAVYIPPDYDPTKRYPLMIVLHGGSANGNLFLGVVLGNNMNWKDYPIHLWDIYEPRWSPDWIVVAPDGFGQVMWRWMGERDVLDVLEDVQRHYSVDPDRVVLCGLSNGGVGAYSIGMRHAWRFSAVLAIAGAPSWLQYAGGRMRDAVRDAMLPLSGMHLAENAINTDFRYYHGHHDTGPMRPRYVEEFSEHIAELDVPYREKWFDAGHDLLYRVHRHGKIYEQLESVVRERRPEQVRLVTGDYRANRQHWVRVTRLEDPPRLARVQARVEGATLQVQAEGAHSLALDLRDAPLAPEGRVPGDIRLRVAGQDVYQGPARALGHVVHLRRAGGGWELGFPSEEPGARVKKPGSSGPLTDAYFGPMLHVYGTARPEHRDALERAAKRGARGWPLWLWHFRQRVVADRELTAELARSHHLVLYATPGSNQVLERIAEKLPIRLEDEAIALGPRRIGGADVGTRFIYPNPEAPGRYVIVQAGLSPQAVAAGHRLPDFLPDYVVYNGRTTRSRPRLTFGGHPPVALGYFDGRWRLPPLETSQGQGGDVVPADRTSRGRADEGGRPPQTAAQPDGGQSDAGRQATQSTRAARDAGTPSLPVPDAPPAPRRPRRFVAPRGDPAGIAARTIARIQQRLPNMRARTPGATWRVEPGAVWRVRPERRCLAGLRRGRIPIRPWGTPLTDRVPSPVELTGQVRGVWFRQAHEERVVLISCELAARLPALARVLRRHGVLGVDLMSDYRPGPSRSFHTMGLALDLMRFWTRDGVLSVLHDFIETPGHETCEAPMPEDDKARKLLQIACELAETKKFSTILTPNFNEGHRDHFHLDTRPNDPRIFIR